MKRILLAIALFLSAVPAFGDCISFDNMRRQVDSVPGAALIALDGAAMERAVEIFNAFAPEGHEATDTAALIELPDGGGFLAGGRNGELCGLVRFDPQRWNVLRISIVGRDA